MFAWIRAIFGSMDRQQAAADRAAKALEDIAGDLESVRDQFRARLGIEAPAAVEPLAVTAHDEPAKGKRAK